MITDLCYDANNYIFKKGAIWMNDSNTLLNELDTNTLCAFFKLMSEKVRLQLVFVLVRKKKLCVSDLAELLNISIATTSHHLQILKKNNLVKSMREGKQIFYYIDNPKVIHFINVGLDFNYSISTGKNF